MRRSIQGFLLLATIAALAALALWHGGFAAWFLGAVTATAAALAWFMHRGSLGGLTVEREATGCDRNGNPTAIRLRLTRTRRIPLAWLVIQEEWTRANREEPYRYSRLLFPGLSDSFELDVDIAEWPRGKYRLSRSEATAGDFFGLFSDVRQLTVSAAPPLIKYPSPQSLAASPSAAGRIGSVTSGRSHSGETSPVMKGLRDYAPGDPLNRIDWKRYSRQQVLKTKELEEEEMDRYLLVLNPSAGQTEASFEMAVAVAAGLSTPQIGNGMIGLVVPGGGDAPPSIQRGERAMDWLAEAGMSERLPLDGLLDWAAFAARGESAILLITSVVSEEIIAKTRELHAAGISLTLLYIMEGPVLSWNERQLKRTIEQAGGNLVEIGKRPHGEGGKGDASA